MREIAWELQKDTHYDYRYAQTILRRLVRKGYLKVEKQSPRRNVWTAVRLPEETLRDAMRFFINQVVGLEPENVQMLRDELEDLERHGPYGSFDASSLPRGLRVRLTALVEGFIGRKRDRWALAAALGLEHTALDQSPKLAGAISLLSAAGGGTITAALKVLDAIEDLLEDEEQEEAREISAIRRQLEALPAS